MASAYSLEKRESVVRFISLGHSKEEAMQVFNVSRNTIYLWLRLAKAGNLSPKKHPPRTLNVPDEILRTHVALHPDDTLKEISEGTGISVTRVWERLKGLGITRKKRPFFTKNDARNNVQHLKSA